MKSQHSFYMEDELYKQLRIHAIERGQSASDFIADVVASALPNNKVWTDFVEPVPPEIQAIKDEIDEKGFENVGEPVPAHVIKTPAEAATAVSLLDRPIHPVPKPAPKQRRSRR